MGKVNLDDIKPGMKLEKDVQDRSGRVLLRAGTESRNVISISSGLGELPKPTSNP